MSLDHAQLVETLFARRGPAANVPLLCAHGLMEAFRRTVRAASTPLGSSGYGKGFRRGRRGPVVGRGVLPGWLEVICRHRRRVCARRGRAGLCSDCPCRRWRLATGAWRRCRGGRVGCYRGDL
jgi:hypothetical protein